MSLERYIELLQAIITMTNPENEEQMLNAKNILKNLLELARSSGMTVGPTMRAMTQGYYEFSMIMRNRYGYLAVGLLAPLAEEVVFRGAVLRALLRWKEGRPWLAIAISALLFSAAHMNPAQLPHTFLVGLLLGWMYYRTDSIVPGVVLHWVNNTVAYVMFNLYPNPDMTLLDLFGSQQRVLMAVGFSLCIFLPALFQLNQNMKK